MTDRTANFRRLFSLRIALFATFIFALLAWLLFAAMPAALQAQEAAPPPSATPDAANGLELFAERCAVCHGPLGQGDGEMAGQLPRPPAAMGSDEFHAGAVPAVVFDVITNGIPEAAMPPFGPPGNSDPLSEQQRWDLVAAVYSLGVTQAELDAGQTVYETSCQECHAADGSGVDMALDLSAFDYWLQRSNEQVAQAITAAPEHEALELDDAALNDVATYARTFTYAYANPLAAFEPIEAATITGLVTNESIGQPLDAGTPAILSAFTADFQPSLTMTSTLNSDGRYSFDLDMVPPDHVYVVTVQHEGISYGSDFGRLERSNPDITLDIPVYDLTTDDATVSVDQLHIIVQFGNGLVQVSELYQFSQNASLVYVGDSGFTSDGTVRIAVPPEADEPSFDRSFGGMESFFPADTVIPTGQNEWSDTVPLRPGPGSLSLLVRYAMPYEDGLALSHPVHYPVSNVNLVLPDVGVSAEGTGWTEGEPQIMGSAGAFLTYNRANVPPGDDLTITLQGTPDVATGATVTPPRDQTNELLVGGGVLLLAIAAGVFVLRQWRSNQEDDDDELLWDQAHDAAPAHEAVAEEEVAPAPIPAPDEPDRRQALLMQIAALDDAYESGEVTQADYEAQRAALKEQLRAIWET